MDDGELRRFRLCIKRANDDDNKIQEFNDQTNGHNLLKKAVVRLRTLNFIDNHFLSSISYQLWLG